MCGIAGFINLSRNSNPETLRSIVSRMTDTLSHRGPDANGWWADESQGIALGHRRLSIIDLSEQGSQPMLSATGELVISFNGEIYNFGELRGELEELGCGFRG